MDNELRITYNDPRYEGKAETEEFIFGIGKKKDGGGGGDGGGNPYHDSKTGRFTGPNGESVNGNPDQTESETLPLQMRLDRAAVIKGLRDKVSAGTATDKDRRVVQYVDAVHTEIGKRHGWQKLAEGAAELKGSKIRKSDKRRAVVEAVPGGWIKVTTNSAAGDDKGIAGNYDNVETAFDNAYFWVQKGGIGDIPLR